MTSSHFLSVKRLSKRNHIAVAAKHNLREIQSERGAEAHIDATRSQFNQILYGENSASGVKNYAENLMREAGVLPLRKNAMRAFEIVISLPIVSTINKQQYFDDSLQWAKDFFGVPVISAVVHRDETDNFLSGYSRDLQQGQLHHLEILLEKNALRSVIESVGSEFCIPVTTGRGYSSLGPREAMAKRYRMSGKKTLVLLMLTDFDPDGEQIAISFARSMRDDFGISVHPVKVALTQEDVLLNDLPSDMDAKPSSPQYKKFVDKYGTRAVELDAAPVKLLQSKLRDVITSYLDVDVFNAQINAEAKDAALLQAHRKIVIQTIGGAI